MKKCIMLEPAILLKTFWLQLYASCASEIASLAVSDMARDCVNMLQAA